MKGKRMAKKKKTADATSNRLKKYRPNKQNTTIPGDKYEQCARMLYQI